MSFRQREGVEVSLHSSFTSTADGGVWLTPPGKNPDSKCTQGCLGAQSLSGRITRIENPLQPREFEPQSTQPVEIRSRSLLHSGVSYN